jgi:hypothetical protein
MGGVGAAWRFLIPAWRRAGLALLAASLFVGLGLARASGVSWWLVLALMTILNASARLWPLAISQGEPPRERTTRVWDLWARELRLLGAAILSLLFLFVLFLLVFVLVLCFAYAAAASGHGFVSSDIATWAPAVDSRGRWVVSLVAIICALAWTWAAMRISLAAPATVEKRKVLMIATWPLTRGRAWAIAAAQTLTLAAPVALIALLIVARRSGAEPAIIVWLAEGLVIAGLWLPLTIGLMGRLYRDLTSGQAQAVPA